MLDDNDRPIRLDRGLLSDRIYEVVKEMIRDSTLKPGEQVVESQLARRLGVSQAPVREALKRLSHEGVVTHIPHHGIFVTEFSQREADDARIARVGLEGLAARLAQRRLNDGTRARLLSIIDQMHAAADRHDIAAFRELDFEFHKTVVVASGNQYLPRVWDIIEPSMRSMHVLSDPKYDGDWHVAAEMHRDLLQVLEGEDPEAADDLFSAHAIGIADHPVRPMGPAINRFIADLTSDEPADEQVDAAG